MVCLFQQILDLIQHPPDLPFLVCKHAGARNGVSETISPISPLSLSNSIFAEVQERGSKGQ